MCVLELIIVTTSLEPIVTDVGVGVRIRIGQCKHCVSQKVIAVVNSD